MPKIINMPKIGVNMTEATIVDWVVKEGDAIKEGDHILDAETDKAVQEIGATQSGVLGKIIAPVGETILCQQPIAVILEDGEELTEDNMKQYMDGKDEGEAEKKTEPHMEEPKAVVEKEIPSVSVKKRRVKISPLAKKTAKDMGIDYTMVSPSKLGARIVKADILSYAESIKTSEASSWQAVSGSVPYTGKRKVIGDRMSQSSTEKPAASLTLHAEAGMLIEWRKKLKMSGKSVSYSDLLSVIAAKALKENPIINSKLEGNEIKMLNDINIGIAVDTDNGLLVPVIKNAGQKGVLETAEEFRKKLDRIKNNKSSIDDLTGGTFTITNLGMFEIEQFTPIINPPECSILAVGSIVREPVVDENDNIKVASRMQLTLVFDHRIVDGAPAARFLQRIKHLIEWPMGLME